jgi:hypothetical protein
LDAENFIRKLDDAKTAAREQPGFNIAEFYKQRPGDYKKWLDARKTVADYKQKFTFDYQGAKAGEAPDFLTHPGLYESYPSLESLKTIYNPRYSGGQLNEDLGGMLIGGGNEKSIGLHELQHAIQRREGFARGGNPRSAADDVGQELLKASERIRKIEADPSLFEGRKAIDEAFDASINGRITNDEFYKIVAQHPIVAEYSKLQSFRRDAPRDGDEAYRRLAGEAEARATQARMNMTPAERRAMFPYESYDVPVNQLIVR